MNYYDKEEDDWEVEEMIKYLLKEIHQLQSFIRSEGLTRGDYEMYLSERPTPTLH